MQYISKHKHVILPRLFFMILYFVRKPCLLPSDWSIKYLVGQLLIGMLLSRNFACPCNFCFNIRKVRWGGRGDGGRYYKLEIEVCWRCFQHGNITMSMSVHQTASYSLDQKSCSSHFHVSNRHKNFCNALNLCHRKLRFWFKSGNDFTRRSFGWKIPRFYRTQIFNTLLTKSRYWSLSIANWIQSTRSHTQCL
jgi:hypothetical protein